MAFTYPCAVCGKQVGDANVMVDTVAYSGSAPLRVPFLRVICKPCTRAGQPQLHNMWELDLFYSSPRVLVNNVKGLIASAKEVWAPAAVDEFNNILAKAHPHSGFKL